MRNKWGRWTAAVAILVLLASSVLGTWQGFAASAPAAIKVDGSGEDWSEMQPLASSETPGYEGFQIGDLHITNDSRYLYFWTEAKNVPNWGSDGMFLNLALNVNEEDSKIEGNPWGAPFHFGGTEAKPQFHITVRIKNDNELAGAALYSSEDLAAPKLSTWDNSKGAQFAADRTKGFEGKIPLSELRLKNDDSIRAIAVLSGNNPAEHGAFDVSPEAEGNVLAGTWNESGNPNSQAVYSSSYTIGGVEEAAQLEVLSSTPAEGDAEFKPEAPLIVTFNENVAVEKQDAVTLSEKDGGDVPAALKAEGNQLSIKAEQLKKGQSYTLTVKKDAVKGQSTNSYLQEDFVLSFATSNMIEPAKRFIQFTYVREDADYADWNIWTWQTGLQDGEKLFSDITEQGAVSKFEISSDATAVGFVIRKGQDWAVKDPYDGDRYITAEAGQALTKVVVESGKGDFHTVPAVKGPVLSEGKATFFYRDPELFADNAMDTVEKVSLKVAGKKYEMAYDEKNEYFSHTVALPGEGTYDYSYLVTVNGTETEVRDPYYEKSSVDYIVPDVSMKLSVSPKAVTSNQNAVLSLDVETDQEVEFTELSADVSALGGPKALKIDPQLMETSLSVADTVTAGVKQIPVTAVDQYGNKHTKTASITVKPRVSKGKGDFDWDEARIYFMLTDRFNDGDKTNNDPNGEGYDASHLETYHGGDFKGITQKLDYLEDLGINTIWITPVVDNIDWDLRHDKNGHQYGYHGYWAKDFSKLDEHLGSMDDLNELLDKAHEKNIKIMVDVVLNHTGYGLKETDAGNTGISNYPTDEDRNRFSGMLRSGGTDVIKGELAGLPDLITEDPAVRKQMIDWQTAWAAHRTEKGNAIDYFRVDTVKHVEDTTWKMFKNELVKINPDFKLIGEYYGGSIGNTGGYLDSGQMDSLLDFNFKYDARDFINGDVEAVEARLEERNANMTSSATMGQFLSSHDEDGFLLTHAGGDISKQKIAAALQITAKGQPVVYYGEEIGQTGKHAGDMDKGEFNENRYDFAWDKTENNDLLTHYQKLLNIRKDYSKVFSKGTRAKIGGSNNEGYLVFIRTYGKHSVAVGLNTTETAQKVTVSVPFKKNTKVIDLYSGKEYKVSAGGKVTADLPEREAGGTFILAEKNSQPKPPGKDEKPDGAAQPHDKDEQGTPPATGGDAAGGSASPDSTSAPGAGKGLPATATASYSIMLIGIVLLAAGFSGWMLKRRFVKRAVQ